MPSRKRLALREISASQPALLSIVTARCTSAIARAQSSKSTESEKNAPGRSWNRLSLLFTSHSDLTMRSTLLDQQSPALIASGASIRTARSTCSSKAWAGRRAWLSTLRETCTSLLHWADDEALFVFPPTAVTRKSSLPE